MKNIINLEKLINTYMIMGKSYIILCLCSIFYFLEFYVSLHGIGIFFEHFFEVFFISLYSFSINLILFTKQNIFAKKINL